MERSAEQARKELEKAMDEQKKGNGKAAEKHLEKALDKLGGDQKQDSGNKDDKQKKDDRKKDSGKKEDQKPIVANKA